MVEIVKEFTSRIEQIHHKIFRDQLSEKQYKDLLKQLDGEYGELLFSQSIQQYCVHALIFYDLRFMIQNKEIQIDCLAVMQDELFIFEIKWTNYDLEFEEDTYYFLDTSDEVLSYRQQKTRICEFFKYFLKRHGLNYKLHFYNVFVNPRTFVYGVKKHSCCLNHTEIKKMLTIMSSRPLYDNHEKLTSILLSSHLTHSQYERNLAIDFTSAKKGVLCSCKKQTYQKKTKRLFTCSCGNTINSQEYLHKCINDLTFLYPDDPLTVNRIYEWSGQMISKRTIREYVNKYYIKNGSSKRTYYCKN